MNSPDSGTRRTRKRQASDSDLSPEDRQKKEKNREAARKCRLKKQNQAEELKKKNKELEDENKKLANDKLKLQNKVDEFLKIIRDHLHKGCEIPSDVESLWRQEDGNDDMADFQPVAVMEAQRTTPPTTPESISSDTSPPSVKSTDVFVGSSMSSANPVGLFGGSPLQVTAPPMKTTRIRTNSQSNRSSQSSSSPSPSATQSPVDLAQYLQLKQVPQALEPIQPGQNCVVVSQTPTVRLADAYINGNHGPSLPTVVSEFVDISSVSCTQTHTLSVPISGVDSQLVMEQAFAHPPILTQDPISSELYHQVPNGADNMPGNNNIPTSNENLPSTGFQFQSAPEGYSFSEDLCRAEAPGEIIGQISLTNQVEPSQSSGKEPVNQSTPTIMAQAQALLSLGERISPSLQQQIMSLSTQTQTSSTASAGEAYIGTAVNQQQLATQQTVKRWVELSDKQHGQMSIKHITSPTKNTSAANVGQFFNLSELPPSQPGQVQVIRLSEAQVRGMKKQNFIINPTPATSSNEPTLIVQQRQSSSPGQVTVQRIVSPQTSAIAGQQFTASSTGPGTSPSATLLTTLPGASQNWVAVQHPQIIPSSSIQDSFDTSSTNPMPSLPSLDMGNLPSLTFTDFDSESNIFEKKAKKSS